jgi:hypothetical protein
LFSTFPQTPAAHRLKIAALGCTCNILQRKEGEVSKIGPNIMSMFSAWTVNAGGPV